MHVLPLYREALLGTVALYSDAIKHRLHIQGSIVLKTYSICFCIVSGSQTTPCSNFDLHMYSTDLMRNPARGTHTTRADMVPGVGDRLHIEHDTANAHDT